jgi:putative inorganic carbon (HCO3(-)) transporter
MSYQVTIKGADSNKSRPGFLEWLKKTFLVEKLHNATGIGLLILFAIVIAWGTANIGVSFGALLIGGLLALPFLYTIVVYPKIGIVILLLMAYFLWQVAPFIPLPIGTVMDGLQIVLLLGVLIQLKRNNDWDVLKHPISTALLAWVIYNVLEIGNPTTESRLAWIYTIRTTAIVTLSYFVYLYNIRSVKFIRLIFKLWLFVSLIGALYAFKQEFIGFSAAEEAYLHSDPNIADLLFIAGHWRKFSIFSDPVSFSYNMVMPSILCVCLIASKTKIWKKIVLAVLIGLCLTAMIFSGTRGANVLMPAALALFAILNYNKRVLIFTCFAAVFLLFLINVPTSNQNIARFQTAFRPNNDDSYTARKNNQKRIQPYILKHPMGGGLGSTGMWGKRFAPGSYLSQFPPDSGYMRIAVEGGWIGLLIFCTLMFVVLKTGINNYYIIKDPELKTYCLAMTMVVFAYNLANFPQEALVQYPSNIFFYMEVALIIITKRLDDELTRQRESTLTAAPTLQV